MSASEVPNVRRVPAQPEVDTESVARETQAMAAMAGALAELKPDERRRVLDWTVQRFRPPTTRARRGHPPLEEGGS